MEDRDFMEIKSIQAVVLHKDGFDQCCLKAHQNWIFKGCLCFLDCNPIILLCCFSRCFKAVNTHTHGRRMKAKPRKHIKLNCSHLIFETSLALTSSPVFPRLYLHEIKRFFGG